MTTKEFDLEFDVLYDNVTSGKAPGLNAYEKSLFLTKAQDQILKNYFNPLGNKYQEGYSDSVKRTVDFSNIMKSVSISGRIGVNTTYKNTMIYDQPDDIFLPVSFNLRNADGKELQVRHVKEDELTRLFSKPYKEPFKGQAYKIDNSTTTKTYEIIVGRAGINDDYILYVRYIRVPSPIILTDFEEYERVLGIEDGYLILRGLRTVSECELDPLIHDEILDRAVNLAKVAYEGSPEAIVQYSTNNE
jgi:hypothetical protein